MRSFLDLGSIVIPLSSKKEIVIRQKSLTHIILGYNVNLSVKVELFSKGNNGILHDTTPMLIHQGFSNREFGADASNVAIAVGNLNLRDSDQLVITIYNAHTANVTIQGSLIEMASNMDKLFKLRNTTLKQTGLKDVTRFMVDTSELTTASDLIIELKINDFVERLTYAGLQQLSAFLNDNLNNDDISADMIVLIMGDTPHVVEWEVKSDEAPIFYYMEVDIPQDTIKDSAHQVIEREKTRISKIVGADYSKKIKFETLGLIPRIPKQLL